MCSKSLPILKHSFLKKIGELGYVKGGVGPLTLEHISDMTSIPKIAILFWKICHFLRNCFWPSEIVNSEKNDEKVNFSEI